jgi:hypothetical protein
MKLGTSATAGGSRVTRAGRLASSAGQGCVAGPLGRACLAGQGEAAPRTARPPAAAVIPSIVPTDAAGGAEAC